MSGLIRPHEVDHRTDVYSIGIVLYELLTGRVPFDSDSDFIVRQAQVQQPPRGVRELNPKLPEALEAVVMRALAKDRDQRYSGCGEFSRAIRELSAGGGTPSAGAGVPVEVGPSVADRTERPVVTPIAADVPAASAKPGKIRWGLAAAAMATAAFAAGFWLRSRDIDRAPLEGEPPSALAGDSADRSDEVLELQRQIQELQRQARVDKVTVDRLREEIAALEEDREAAAARRPPPAVPAPRGSKAGELIRGPLGMRFRYVPPGSFKMGSPTTEDGRYGGETRHDVTLTRGFWIGETEVTQAQWRRLVEKNPSRFTACGDSCPVEKVNWFEAVTYANRLSDEAGLKRCYELGKPNGKEAGDDLEYAAVESRGPGCEGYRLPTEAEWEYATRAGSATPFSTGSNLTTKQANYDGDYRYALHPKGEYRRKTVPVRSFDPNPWGLYEVHGNVREWVRDWYAAYPGGAAPDPVGPERGSFRVIRGGSWGSEARVCRSADRSFGPPWYRASDVGFRLVRTAP